ncbi:MAG: ATP-binding protein [Chromatiales bacterium]|nr:ATP-binding protein [Chromatiales bacterium]
MLKLNKFFLSDVRCFKGEKEFNIRPLTFLIGENSTGKSTVLGCIHAIGRYIGGQGPSINFQWEPFEMGGFTNIARRATPKNTEFELGFEFDSDEKALKHELRITLGEQSDSATPVIKQIGMTFSDREIIFIPSSSDDNEDSPRPKIDHKGSKKVLKILLPTYVQHSLSFSRGFYYLQRIKHDAKLSARDHRQVGETSVNSEEEEVLQFFTDKVWDKVSDKVWDVLRLSLNLYGFAPIRSEPHRTYDPLFDDETPYGHEIPLILRRLSFGEKEKWNQLKEKLVKFGKSSGLFTDIQVRNLGRSLSNPFQLQFKIRGAQATNLIDVGYGVSQILPIVTRVLMATESQFLMQQPEVHLHPKAQAALTSLLVKLTKPQNNSFIIETHSDYLIDRARIEIMRGNIAPDDVSLIYLESKRGDVAVHNLCFDEEANFKEYPPDGYRKFFLQEAHRLLGWDD